MTGQVVRDKENICGIRLASARSTVFAGADLKALMRLRPEDAPSAFRAIEQTRKNLRTLETPGKPVVRCINGFSCPPERHRREPSVK